MHDFSFFEDLKSFISVLATGCLLLLFVEGVLSTVGHLREGSTSYTFRAVARNAGCPHLESSTLVTVELTDNADKIINDLRPQFEQSQYELFLLENIRVGSIVLRFRLKTGVDG